MSETKVEIEEKEDKIKVTVRHEIGYDEFFFPKQLLIKKEIKDIKIKRMFKAKVGKNYVYLYKLEGLEIEPVKPTDDIIDLGKIILRLVFDGFYGIAPTIYEPAIYYPHASEFDSALFFIPQSPFIIRGGGFTLELWSSGWYFIRREPADFKLKELNYETDKDIDYELNPDL